MLSYQSSVGSPLTSPQPADVSSASILKSVREQEAQFERLARTLEKERESVSHQHQALGPDHSRNSSMNSVRQDESYSWSSSPQHNPSLLQQSRLDTDDSEDTSKLNSNLLDSCLRELEDRGTLNSGYDREDSSTDYMQPKYYHVGGDSYSPEDGSMDYMQPEYNHGGGDSFYSPQAAPYAAGGGGGGGGNYANTSFDRGSHASLQSNGSNRPRQAPVAGDRLGGGGNYSSYGPPADDMRQSPMPRSASPASANYYQQQPPYHNLPPLHQSPAPSGGLGPDPHSSYPRHDDSFGSRDDYPGSRNSYNRPAEGSGYGGQAYDDNYADPPYNSQPAYRDSPMGDPQQARDYRDYQDDRDLPQGPPYDDSYGESPYAQQNYNNAAPPPINGRADDDRYDDRQNDSLPPRHDDSFQGGMRPGDVQGQPPYDHNRQPSYDQDPYADAPRQRASYDHDVPPQAQYGLDDEPRYRGSYDHEGQGYSGAPPPEENGPRYRGSYDQEGPQGQGYLGPPNEENAPPLYSDNYEQQGPAYGGHPGGEVDPQARYRDSYNEAPPNPDMYGQSPLKFEGLPVVQADPFADDPFRDQRSHDGSFSALREDPYHRGPSPYNHGPSPSGGSDIYGDRYYDTRPPDDYAAHPYGEEGSGGRGGGGAVPYDDHPNARPDDYPDARAYPGDMERPYYPEEDDMLRRMDALKVGAPPGGDGYRPDDRRTPSIDGRPPVGYGGGRPDLQEVIDYLNNPDDSVKANAAAYLQHLSYNDDSIKAKTRGLDGIRPLIQLLNHELTEVHKNSCGALQNLSFGKANDENKKAIKNAGGIPELIRLLRKTGQEDVMDSVTGILWNLSSCEDLKPAILEDGLTVLVNTVVIPYSGWSSISNQPNLRPWTTVFRNTTGILRNVSSAGYEARKRLRECRGLVQALIHTLQLATGEIINCKPVENVVCTLRNLSYRIQEMEDPDFYKKRSAPKVPATGAAANKGGSSSESGGCFGGSSSKKTPKKGSIRENQPAPPPPNLPPTSSEYRSLWGSDLIVNYLALLKKSTNPVSIEAAAGAIQNLTACDWAPAVDCRAFIRKAKGLPNLVDLLTNDSHRVVCAAATALRNLTIDNTNKELIGKYSIQQLVAWLPRDSRHSANKSPDDLTCAVLATLYEVVRSNQNYAVSLIQEDGLSRLKYINTSDGRFLPRTLKINHTILKTLWSFKTLHPQYNRMGFSEQDFTHSRAMPRIDGHGDNTKNYGTMPPGSNQTTPYNTLSRPISAQGYDDNTLSAGRLPRHDDRGGGHYGHSQHGGSRLDMDGYLAMNQSNPALFDQGNNRGGNYSRDGGIPPDSVPLNDMGPGYAPLDEPRPHIKPVGGVLLFPNLPPGASELDHSGQQDLSAVPEPLYAQVNKGRRRNDDYARQTSGGGIAEGPAAAQEGADSSWV